MKILILGIKKQPIELKPYQTNKCVICESSFESIDLFQYATWDLAFHMLPFSKIDPQFAKDQLLLFLREWYMAPNGQLPAYEFALGDVNPPVHALACLMVYKMTGRKGARDDEFLSRCFQKLLINFTW